MVKKRFKKHVRVYITVFIALGILTGVTVLASYLKVSVGLGILLALIIASIKASLVACYFMHLITEQKFVYNVLALTACFFVVMMALIWSSNQDQQGTHESEPTMAPDKIHDVH